jgi:uncharacterized protein DUF5309
LPGITDPEQVGKRQNLSDVFYLLAVTKTPLTSQMRKGGDLEKQLYFEYQVGKLGARKTGGVPDGKDFEAFDGATPRALLAQRGEVFRRAPMVGFVAAGNDIAGIGSEWTKAKSDQLVEHKKDMEFEFFSDQDSRADDGVNGSKFRGLGRFVNDGTLAFSELPIPSGFRTPTIQCYTGVLGDGINTGITEAAIANILQQRWEQAGDSMDLTGFVSATIKNRFGLFSRYVPNIASATPVVRLTTGVVDGATLFGATIDIYKSDYGTFRLMAVPLELLPDQYRGYLLDMTQIRLRVREMTKEIPLQDQGGGPRQGIRSIIGPEWGDPRSHIKIACSGA